MIPISGVIVVLIGVPVPISTRSVSTFHFVEHVSIIALEVSIFADNLDERNSFYGKYDFAPRDGYALDHIEWRSKTFLDYLDMDIISSPFIKVYKIWGKSYYASTNPLGFKIVIRP